MKMMEIRENEIMKHEKDFQRFCEIDWHTALPGKVKMVSFKRRHKVVRNRDVRIVNILMNDGTTKMAFVFKHKNSHDIFSIMDYMKNRDVFFCEKQVKLELIGGYANVYSVVAFDFVEKQSEF